VAFRHRSTWWRPAAESLDSSRPRRGGRTSLPHGPPTGIASCSSPREAATTRSGRSMPTAGPSPRSHGACPGRTNGWRVGPPMACASRSWTAAAIPVPDTCRSTTGWFQSPEPRGA
jgi:hypothetical protein